MRSKCLPGLGLASVTQCPTLQSLWSGQDWDPQGQKPRQHQRRRQKNNLGVLKARGTDEDRGSMAGRGWCDMGNVHFLEQKNRQFTLIKRQTMESQRGKAELSLSDIKPIFPILFCG